MAQEKHNVVRLDKVQSVYSGNLEHLINQEEDMDNGLVCFAGELFKGGIVDGLNILPRDIVKVAKPTAENIKTEPLVFIASDPVVKDARTVVSRADFYNVKNRPMKGYILKDGDIITITKDAFEGEPEVGKYLSPVADSHKLTIADAMPETRFKAIIIEKTTLTWENTEAYAFKVLAN